MSSNDAMEIDRNDLEVLSRDECVLLLAGATVARIGVTMDALPVVLPVNFVIDGDRIVLRTGAGTKLSAALANAVVAIEVDWVDTMNHAGWSVLVQGMSHVLEDPFDIARVSALPLRPWSTERADMFVTIDLDRVSGRRLCSWHPPHDHAAGHHPFGAVAGDGVEGR